MSKRRNYRQFCGIAKALDAVGERWTLLIARDMLLGPRRYSDLLANLKGITTNLLAQRLKEMTAAGLIESQELSAPGRGSAYVLTDVGRELEPALLALGAWGWRFMEAPKRGDRMYLGWVLIALKRRFRGVDRPLTAEVSAEGLCFQVRLTAEGVDLREGAPWIADVAVVGSFTALGGLMHRGQSSSALQQVGALEVSGEPTEWEQFLKAFDLRS
jgi:DNA-binding HxlR family transcriptional regulator